MLEIIKLRNKYCILTWLLMHEKCRAYNHKNCVKYYSTAMTTQPLNMSEILINITEINNKLINATSGSNMILHNGV
jgi:hypothetical protein